jgi:hypothetical protein
MSKPLGIMDLKANMMYGQPREEAQAYRFQCFNCEHYKTPILGGILIDGEIKKKWFCHLIDEQGTKCRFDTEKEETQTVSRQTPKVDESRLPLNQDSKPQLQQQFSSPDISGPSKPHPEYSGRPAPTLPRLPSMEGPKSRSNFEEHKEH